MAPTLELQLTDYVVFGICLSLSILVGVYYAYKNRHHTTMYRYHRGGGKLNALPVALSLLVTFESSIFFIGYPTEVYLHGLKFWLYNIAVLIGYSGMIWVSVPLFYPLQVTSVFEYLQKRYDSLIIRQVATILGIITMTIYAGIVVFGAAINLEAVTRIPVSSAIVGMVVLAVIYTSLGGIKAVIATDVVQCIVMIVGIIAVLIYGTISIGGVGKVIEISKPSGRLDMVDFDPNPLTRHTFWSLLIGGSGLHFALCFRQPAVQRLNSTKSISEARKVVYIALPCFAILQFLVMLEGIVAFAYFSNIGCDPVASGIISNPNQIISFTVLHLFQRIPGIPGLFIAALICASLSTISSLLSSLSAIISEDFLRVYWKDAKDASLTKASKLIVVICGVLCIGMALFIGQVKGPLSQITGSILDAMDGTMTGLFVLSIFFKTTTRKGFVIGTSVGFCFSVWLSFGYNFSSGRKVTPYLPLGPVDKCDVGNYSSEENSSYNASFKDTTISFRNHSIIQSDIEQTEIHGLDYLYSISYMYFALMVLVVTVVAGLVSSKFTRQEYKVPPYLILSPWKKLFSCIPQCREPIEEKQDYTEVVVLHDRVK